MAWLPPAPWYRNRLSPASRGQLGRSDSASPRPLKENKRFWRGCFPRLAIWTLPRVRIARLGYSYFATYGAFDQADLPRSGNDDVVGSQRKSAPSLDERRRATFATAKVGVPSGSCARPNGFEARFLGCPRPSLCPPRPTVLANTPAPPGESGSLKSQTRSPAETGAGAVAAFPRRSANRPPVRDTIFPGARTI